MNESDQLNRPPRWEGGVHPAYGSARPEVTDLVPRNARTVLDIGCSVGAVTAPLRSGGVEVTGIEADAGLATLARAALDRVVEADVEALVAGDAAVEGGPFDCVVLADVLEHLVDPWSVVRWVERRLLAPGGAVVVSVPNIRHARTVGALVRGHWPYEDVGIFDRTHLRFFARRNLPELLDGTGLHITELRRNRLLVIDLRSRWNRLAPYLGDWGTLQFLFRAERRGPGAPPPVDRCP